MIKILLLAAIGYWFNVMPPSGEYLGEHKVRTRDGMRTQVVVFSRDSANEIVTNANYRIEHGIKIILDIDHASDEGKVESRVAGEFRRFRVEPDGAVSGLVVFNDFGSNEYHSGFYTHISPSFLIRHHVLSEKGKPTFLRSAAMTNHPFHPETCQLACLGVEDIP